MAAPTYSIRALVLRRTKLGETDVICTLLSADGSQVRAVAKGARKPTSSFASRLEVYSVCDLLVVQGKSLDIIKEARLIQPNAHLRTSYEAAQSAAPMVELLDRTTQDGLEDATLFDMTCKALACLEQCSKEQLPLFCAAHLLKLLAMLGFRPSFTACVSCGSPYALQTAPQWVPFSLIDGGVVCPQCVSFTETMNFDVAVVQTAHYLLFSTFETIATATVRMPVVVNLLRFLQLWVRQHTGVNLKSLSFLIGNMV